MLSWWSDRGLQWRVPIFVGLGLLVILGTFASLSFRVVDESRDRTLQERLLMAQLAARHLDLSVEQSLDVLRRTAALPEIDLADGDPAPERAILSRVLEQGGAFRYNMFLMDASGEVVVAVPEDRPITLKAHAAGQAQIAQTLATAKPEVSGLQCAQAAQYPIVCLTVPVLDAGGGVVGLLGGSLDLSSPTVGGFIGSLALGKTGYAQVVDRDGLVLADTANSSPSGISVHSSHFAGLIAQNRSVVTPCHTCHEVEGMREVRRDVIAFAPLTTAPWGVAISQAESEAFAPAQQLQQQALLLSLVSVAVAIMFAWFSVRAVVRPVGALTGAAERIAGGDLSESVAVTRRDEIGRLARAFETMRLRLRDSLERIQGWNRELEEAVTRRTRELEQSKQAIGKLYEELRQKERARGFLLQKVITAQEEERRRIARELHDETSQALSALAMGIEAAAADPRADAEGLKARLAALKPLVIGTLEEVHNLIFDLRPACLDDLGLVAALQWYAEKRLAGLGIVFQLVVEGQEARLPNQMEAAVFRVVQEALTNIIKHAEADRVSIRIAFAPSRLELAIADDGRGFDVERTRGHELGIGGYGLLGMQERVDLLGGTLTLTSRPGEGTHLAVVVPLGAAEVAVV